MISIHKYAASLQHVESSGYQHVSFPQSSSFNVLQSCWRPDLGKIQRRFSFYHKRVQSYLLVLAILCLSLFTTHYKNYPKTWCLWYKKRIAFLHFVVLGRKGSWGSESLCCTSPRASLHMVFYLLAFCREEFISGNDEGPLMMHLQDIFLIGTP